MKLLLLALLSLYISVTSFAQTKDSFCHPKKTDALADSIIKITTESELNDLKTSEDFWNSDLTYPFNYEDIEPIINYAVRNGYKLFNEGYALRTIREYVFNKVRREEMCLTVIIEKYGAECCDLSKAKNINGVYIPKDIEGCMKDLDKLWSIDLKQKFKNKKLDELYEFELGRSLRNDWGLWSGSRLRYYFYKIGISNPENISYIILSCYRRHLLDEPIQFNEEVEKMRKSLLATRQPSLKEFPKEVRNVRIQRVTYLKSNNETDLTGAVRFYSPMDTTFYWLYNYRLGWKRITPAQFKESGNTKDLKSWIETLR